MEAVCFYCNTKGHWKHSYPKYLKDGKVKKGSHSCMFMIELHNTTTTDSWVLDTGCGAHIYIVLQGLKESRRLKHREFNLVIGNKKITPVTRIGKYEIMLKSGVRIDLYNCFYSSEMKRNIILFHALSKDGYKFLFDNENGDILVYSNSCFIFKVSPCKGIYEIVKCISHNGNVILNVGSSNEHDKSKLWHSSLGHVNKKRIAQLQKDGVLESFDFKLDDVCESCLLGKMTKLPFIGSCERVNTDSQQEVGTPVKPNDISLPIYRTSGRVNKPPQLNYGFHSKEDKICDSTLSELDEPAKYQEAMPSPKAAKWKEAMKSEI
nr:hypothetical protein [Tanacetum cinerariifolium]